MNMAAALAALAGAAAPPAGAPFPPPLDSYAGEEGLSLWGVLLHRAQAEPLNAVATALFLLAILHTFLAPRFLAASHRLRERVEAAHGPGAHSGKVEVLHFLGEVEAVFGIWVLPLMIAITVAKGSKTAEAFLGRVNFTEPLFVVVVMALASTRPVLSFAEAVMGRVARLGGGTPFAWWLSTLTLGPLLGSLITEPAAMIICALLLGRRVLDLDPTRRLRYATLGLLFVNVSVGGTLTHFAAPPVLMVAARFGWDTPHMLANFGWKAAVAIALSNLLYAAIFRKDLQALAARAEAEAAARDAGARPDEPTPRSPVWIVVVHLVLLALVVKAAHTPPLFVGLFLFFMAFHAATAPHQQPLDLRAPILVGFFLAGLVVHGALQQWWIAPVLGRLDPLSLLFGAAGLTAFNDNAAITYLASLVPTFDAAARYAVVAGAVAGGGLTVIANAPNPAGQAALARYFPDGVKPASLAAAALAPTAIVLAAFLWL